MDETILSIVIVNYNVKKFLKNCIQSCLDATQNLDAEIIVVDNNSTDNSREYITRLFPQVIWLQNAENAGFSRANNTGVQKASGKYVLVLNPDTIVPPDIFDKIIPFAESKKDLGALGVRIVDADNKYRPESKRNIPNPKNTFNKLFTHLNVMGNSRETRGYYNDMGEYEIGTIEILTGCFFFTTRKLYNETGGFDEAYFMYGEDIDLSYVILKSGYQNYYFGESTIVHYKGESTVKDKTYYRRFFNAMNIFVKKYYKKPFLLYILLRIGLKVRYYLALLIDCFHKK
jgi:GT2 family glycosyltransferase